MAACPDGDAEKALQRILKKYDLTLNVPRTNLTCAPNCTVPVLLPEDYIRLLSEKGYLHKLLGGPLESRAFVSNYWDPWKHPAGTYGVGGPMKGDLISLIPNPVGCASKRAVFSKVAYRPMQSFDPKFERKTNFVLRNLYVLSHNPGNHEDSRIL